MAAKHLCLLLLLTLLSSLHIHARDVQMFNKVPSKINENVVKDTEVPKKEEPLNTKEQEPNFIPENENSYGLYGHESGQLPPSTTTIPNNEPYKSTTNLPNNAETKGPLPKYLPKNYNPVAYVTEPEDFSDASSFMDKSYTTTDNNNNNNNYYNGGNNYYNGQENGMKDSEFMEREYPTTNKRNNYYNNAGNNYNVQQNGMSGTMFMDRAYTTPNNNNNNNNNNYYTGGRVNRVQQQGLSDTRFLHNGRYFYNINAEKYSRDPYENSKEVGLSNDNSRGYYGNGESSYQNNNFMEGQEQYQDEEDMP